MTESKKDIINLVKASLRNEKNLELYKPQITQKIKASNKTYITCTVDLIKKVIKDKKEDGFTKLFALFLLKEIMDTKNSELVAYVHKKILRRLGIIALGKQDQYFPKDTSPSLIDSFTQLLIECIVVWHDWFGLDQNKKPTKYWTVYNDLVVHKVPIPKKKTHFPDHNGESALAPRSGNQSEVRSGTRQPREIDLEASSGSRVNKPQEEIGSSQPRRQIEIKPDNKDKEDDFATRLNNTLKKIKQNKEILLEAMLVHEEPDTQGVVQILQELKGCNKELQNAANDLVVKEIPNKDQTIDQVLNDSDIITKLIQEYQRCYKGETTFDDYRVFVVELLSNDLGIDLNSLPPSDARKTISLEQEPIKEEEREDTEPKERNEMEVNREETSQKASPMVVNSSSKENQQQNEGFDFDAFEEQSPQHQLQNQRAPPPRRQSEEEEEKEVKKEVRKASRVDPKAQTEGSQYSEGGTRKAPRTFQDLFTSDKSEGRGRRMTRDRNDSSKGSIKFGASWDTKAPEPKRAQRVDQGVNKEGSGIGFEDFEDLPAPEPTNTFDDSSAISESGMYNFNYESRGKDQDRSGSRGRSTFKSRDESMGKWSPSPNRNVLGADEYGIRGSRRVSPNAESQAQFEREQQQQAEENARRNQRNLSVDTSEVNRGYRVEVKKPVEADQNNNYGFGNPFGEDATNGEEELGFSGGFGKSTEQSKNILIQNQEPSTISKKQAQSTPQQKQNNTRPVSRGDASLDFQPILGGSTVRPSDLNNTSKMSPASRFPPIERPSFLGKFDTFQTLNITSFSEGPTMRQADELLERARRLTSQKLPTVLERPSFLASPPPQLLLNDPMRRDDAFKRDSTIKPPVSFAEPIGTVPLYMNVERIDPFKNASFTQATYAEGGLLRELEKARDMSRAIAAQYSSPHKRSQSEGPLRLSAVQSTKYLGTETYSPGKRDSALVFGSHPTKYLNREANSPARKEGELKKSQYLTSPKRDETSFRSKDLKLSSYFARTEENKQTPTKERITEKLEAKNYSAASESKEFARAIELIEKAKRLREESQQRSLKKESNYFRRSPKADVGGAHSLKNSRLDASNIRESAYLERNRAQKPYEGGLRQSRIQTEVIREEGERHKQYGNSDLTFNGRTEQHRTSHGNIRHSMYEPNPEHLANLPNTVLDIKSRNIQSNSMIGGNEMRLNRHEKVYNKEPMRLIGPDGKIYEEVRNGVGRKPTHSEEARLLEKKHVNNNIRESPAVGGTVRGRSRETKYETLGQLRQSRVNEARDYSANRDNIRNTHIKENPVYITEMDKKASPSRSYIVNSDVVELGPGQTAKIVERPVPGSVNKRNRSTSRGSPRHDYTKEVEQKHVKNRIPPTVERVVSQGSIQAKAQINSHKLAAEIKNEIEELKRSLVVKKRSEDKQESASSKGTLQLDSYGTRPQQTLPKENVAWRTNEEMKVETVKMTREEINGRTEPKEERKPVTGVIINTRDDEEVFKAATRKREQEAQKSYIKAEPRESDLSIPITPIEPEEDSRVYARRLDVREISGIKGVKLTMDNSDMWEEESTVRTRGLEDSLRRDKEYYKVQGVNKPKWGRFVNYDYYLFDKIANTILSNGQGKDIDGYKNACLLNKTVLFESARLKIDVITRLEDEQGREDSTLKVILHYGNKSNQSITGFVADILDQSIERNPQINGASLAPRYQLKQELYINFFNFRNAVYTVQLSYQHEGLPYGVNLPLPLSINKFMKMDYVSSSEYKKQWKTLKQTAIKSKYKHINAKFIRDHTEINKYFNNCLVDVTPMLNPKRKRKYGGVFVLPDKREYYLKITMDTSRVKFVVSSGSHSQQQLCEWAVQYLVFLLTV